MTTGTYTGTYHSQIVLSLAAPTVTITPTGLVEATGGTAVQATGDATYVVINYGTIDESVAAGNAVILPGPGTIDNAATTSVIEGVNYAIFFQGGAGATGYVANQGTVDATDGTAIYMVNGGTVTNIGTGSLIEGLHDAIRFGSGGSVSNAGTIECFEYAITASQGGSVTNGSASDQAAVIEGKTGIVLSGAAGTIVNYGTIDGRYFTAVDLEDGGTVVNEGLIETGGGFAGASVDAVDISSAGYVTNNAGGTIVGGGGLAGFIAEINGFVGGAGIDLSGGGSVVNHGTIEGGFGGLGYYVMPVAGGGGTGGIGVALDGGTLTNDGKIVGGFGGAGATVGTGTDYAGGYGGYGGAGVKLLNGAGLSNSGVIEGGQGGYGGNGGYAGGVGGNGGEGGAGVEVETAGTVVNDGTIEGGAGGLGGNGSTAGSFGREGDGVILDVGGLLQNGSAGNTAALIKGYYGVLDDSVGAGTIVDYGTIEGTGDAVVMGAEDLLIAEAGSDFIGLISGGDGTLKLAGGDGTITGLGGTGTLSVADSGTFSGFAAYIIGATGTWTLAGTANAVAAAQTLADNGHLTLAAGASLALAGLLEVNGGVFADDGQLSGAGTIELTNGATADLTGAVSGITVDFNDPSLLELAQGGNYSGVAIENLGAGDAIDLRDIAFHAGDTATYANGHLYLYSSGDTLLAKLDATEGTGVTGFTVVEGAGGGTEIETICFMPGTRIRTPAGDAPVETLRIADLVATADGEAVPIRWIGRQTVSTRFGDPLRVLPIRIRAGALGDNLPVRDLLCSPDHALLIDRVLVQAGALVNGTTIVRETDVPEIFTYYHIECDGHELILAEGVPAETFVDNVDRLAFDNWDEHRALFPAGKPVIELAHPRAKAWRQVPASIRTRLTRRAAGAGRSAA